MSSSDLAALVRSYLDDDEITLLPEEPDRERRLNTWCFTIPVGPVDVAAVVAALHIVLLELNKRWLALPASGTFYAWYDAQAGQLRCSLTSASSERLPFSGRYHSTFDASEVVALAAADPNRGLVPYMSLQAVDAADAYSLDQELSPTFSVWVAPVG